MGSLSKVFFGNNDNYSVIACLTFVKTPAVDDGGTSLLSVIYQWPVLIVKY